MKRQTMGWRCVTLWFSSGVWMGATGAQAVTGRSKYAALAVIEEGAVSCLVVVTRLQWADQVRVAVEGYSFRDVSAWTAAGRLKVETVAGVQLTAESLACPSAIVFGMATHPVLAKDPTVPTRQPHLYR
jgi:hypothetical protein